MQCNVLLVSNLYPPLQIGGYELAAHDVATGLEEQGMNVIVLTSDYRAGELNHVEPSVLRQLKLVNSWFGDYPVTDIHGHAQYNYEKTAGVLEALRPRIVYAWNQINLGAGVLEAVRRAGIPILHHIMGVDLLSYMRLPRTWHTLLLRWIMHRKRKYPGHFVLGEGHMRNMVFLSRYMRDYYQRADVRPTFGTVIYPGVPVDRIRVKSNYELAGTSVNVVYVGQFAPHKGVLQLKEALCNLKAQRPELELKLTLFGSGEPDFVRGLLSETNIPVENKGFVTRDILYQQLCTYDIGVFSSTWQEPFGIAQIELMGAGLPVITSATGGAAEPVRAEYNAIVFKAADVRDLAGRLSSLIDQYRDKAAFIGRNARQTVERSFTKQAMDQQVMDAVERVMHEADTDIARGSDS